MIDQGTEERAVARAMALLSTLSTAANLVRTMCARRLGQDPSEEQSPDVVLPSLAHDLHGLDDHLIALRTSLVAAEREASYRVALVRHVNDVILLGGLSHSLHGIHQRLMSLYPRIGEDLVENARRLHRRCADLIESENVTPETLVEFIDEATYFLATIRSALPRKTTGE